MNKENTKNKTTVQWATTLQGQNDHQQEIYKQ